MIPTNLKLSNFTSYGESPPELDFTKFKLAAISGLNGAGKSSLLDAITWCVWGTSRAGDSADSLVHSGADSMQVEFSFELDGHSYTIKRRRLKKSGGSTALEFWSKSHNLTEGTIKTTQEKIINTLHLSFETFTNSSYLRQGHADEFTTKGPTDRKRILSDILGLAHYDKLEEKAKEKSKDAQINLDRLSYQLLEIEAELSQKEQLEEKKNLAEKKINQVEEDITILEKELKALQNQVAILNATQQQQDKLKQTLSELQNELNSILSQGKARSDKIKQLESELIKLPGFNEKLKELKRLEKEKEEYSTMLQKRMELTNRQTLQKSNLAIKEKEREIFSQKIKELESHIQDLEKVLAKCPTCGQIINQIQKQKVKLEYLEKLKKLKTDLQKIDSKEEESEIFKLQTAIEAIKLDDNKYGEILGKISELSTLQEKREQLIAAQATLESEKKVVVELRVMFVNRKSQIEKMDNEAKNIPNLTTDLTMLQNQTKQKETQLNNLRTEEKEARNQLGQATQLISRIEQLGNLQKTRLEEKEKFTKEKQIFDELSLAFGKKGIQAMIIEAAIPEIEDETNSLLNRLTEGRMKVSLQTQRETKTKLDSGEKGMVETLDIIISDEMGERPYEMYSGGEAFRVNFAIRLAISKLLTHRAGAKLQLLIIDEGFGSQDAPGRARLVEAIDAIKNDFEKILVITHLEELKEEFPVRIEVSKSSTGSTFEVVGV